MGNILESIMTLKRKEVAEEKLLMPLDKVNSFARTALPARGFFKALKERRDAEEIGIIAEIKKASPSKGVIRQDFNPAELARAYEKGGATCLSVLTDAAFFQGDKAYLQEVRSTSTLPVLRKDFLFDPYQVMQSRALGADCILVIMAIVNDDEARTLIDAAKAWKMDVLVEVHDHDELERAAKLDVQMIGINNRNLQDFTVDLALSENLAALAPETCLLVSESGISTPDDIARLRDAGISTFLVGESLMRHQDVGAALRRLSA